MKLRTLALIAAGLGALALVACSGQHAVTLENVASIQPASSTANGGTCETSPWTGALNPEGRPDSLDPGDSGSLYVWHDGDGWHIRATDVHPRDHHYAGTVALDPGSRFMGVQPVALERDDRVWVDGQNVLHYDFHTYQAVDGVDFRVSCRNDGRERQSLIFHTFYDGRPVADRVKIGDRKVEPANATFGFRRTV
jgi:hypothetical protein